MLQIEAPAAARQPVDFVSRDPSGLIGSTTALQLTGGLFECRGSQATGGGVRVTEVQLDCGLHLTSAIAPSRLAIVLVRPGPTRAIAFGTSCSAATCLVASGAELELVTHGPVSILAIELERTAVDWAAPGAPVRAALLLRASERAAIASFALERLEHARLQGQACGDVLEAGLTDIVRSLVERGAASAQSRADRHRERLVKDALEVMWSRVEEPPTLQDVCSAAQCSVRTLIYAFNATFAMSPMKYFKIQRLNAAHRRLQHAAPGTHIFDVAADFGFWHLGHFGVDYKALFGTTPKTTSRVSK